MLETERLLMRPFEASDLDEFAEIVADPEVMRFLGGPPMTRADAWRALAMLVGHEHLRGWGNNALIEKATGRLLGRAGLWFPEGWPGLEVGWVLGRFAWGQGFATEAAVAWRDYAFDVLGAEELVSVVHPDNARSIAVAERIGHSYLRDVTVNGTQCRLYGQPRPGPAAASG